MNIRFANFTPASRRRSRILCAVGLSFCSLVSAADDRAATEMRAPAALVRPAAKPAAARQPPDVQIPPTRPATPAAVATALPDFNFRSVDTPAERLARMRSLPVMMLWQGRRTQVYLGVDQKGVAGLHFRQRHSSADQVSLWLPTLKASRNVPAPIAPSAPRSVTP
jgi:hypothetical protein